MRPLVTIALALALMLSSAGCRVASPPSTEIAIQDLGVSLDECLTRNHGKPVLIAFVAHWSPTALGPLYALEAPEAAEAMQRHGVVAVIADMTEREDLVPTIAAFGRKSVPFTVLYKADRARKAYVSEHSSFLTIRNGRAVGDGEAVARIIRENL